MLENLWAGAQRLAHGSSQSGQSPTLFALTVPFAKLLSTTASYLGMAAQGKGTKCITPFFQGALRQPKLQTRMKAGAGGSSLVVC